MEGGWGWVEGGTPHCPHNKTCPGCHFHSQPLVCTACLTTRHSHHMLPSLPHWPLSTKLSAGFVPAVKRQNGARHFFSFSFSCLFFPNMPFLLLEHTVRGEKADMLLPTLPLCVVSTLTQRYLGYPHPAHHILFHYRCPAPASHWLCFHFSGQLSLLLFTTEFWSPGTKTLLWQRGIDGSETI